MRDGDSNTPPPAPPPGLLSAGRFSAHACSRHRKCRKRRWAWGVKLAAAVGEDERGAGKGLPPVARTSDRACLQSAV